MEDKKTISIIDAITSLSVLKTSFRQIEEYLKQNTKYSNDYIYGFLKLKEGMMVSLHQDGVSDDVSDDGERNRKIITGPVSDIEIGSKKGKMYITISIII